MKRLIIVTVNALIFGALMVSCNGGASDNTSYYTEEGASNTYSNNNEEVKQDTKEISRVEESLQTEDVELRSLCNTKWEFTDAKGRKFVLKINDFSSTGKSVKAELFKDGEHNANGTISLDWRDPIYQFTFPTVELKDKAYIYYPDDSSWLEFACWDYENGFLYISGSAWEAEDPSLRLKIKRVK